MCAGSLRAVVAVGAVRVHCAGRRRADADHAGDAEHSLARHHQGSRAAGAAPRSRRALRQTERYADDVTVLATQFPADPQRHFDVALTIVSFKLFR